jgi:hypothetical protein
MNIMNMKKTHFNFLFFLALPMKARQGYIVFRFVIEYRSLRDFDPY